MGNSLRWLASLFPALLSGIAAALEINHTRRGERKSCIAIRMEALLECSAAQCTNHTVTESLRPRSSRRAFAKMDWVYKT